MGLKRTLLFLCLWITAQPLAGQSVEYYNEILARGEEAVEAGDQEAALQIWMEAVDTTSRGLTDPRIGRAFIETVTKDSLTDYYEQAQQAYLWGLEDPNDLSFTDELIRQVSWLQPVSDTFEYAHWQRLLEQGRYRELGASIRGFWEQVDLTLGTPFNEQLLKYWERIAYAREHFTENGNTVYGTDDRGEIYVRLAGGDRLYSGRLGRSFMGNYGVQTMEQVEVGMRPGGQNLNEGPGFQKTMTFEGGITLLNSAQLQSMYERNPQFEIWIYDEAVSDESSNLIYIFGKEGGAWEYGLRLGLIEFLPSHVRTQPVGLFLAEKYYRQLRSIDPFFENAFQEITHYPTEFGGSIQGAVMINYSLNRGDLERSHERAPEVYNSDLPLIPVELRQYRLLDEENRPRLLSFLYSSPWMPMYRDPVTRDLSGSEYYLSAHTITLDSLNDIIHRASGSGQSLRQNFLGNIMNMPPRVSYLSVPYDTAVRRQKFTLEMHHLNLGSDRNEQLFPENLRALGSLITEDLPPPLSTDRSQLEMGDLILGIRDTQRPEQDPFGFLIPLEPVVEAGDPLMVHVEVYHLQGSPGEPAPFQVQYRVSENRNLVQRLFTRDDEVNLTFNFEAFSDSFRENLEIDTSPFEPGSYTLHLTARQGDREVSRSVEFIVEE